jgi:hypothetical protein
MAKRLHFRNLRDLSVNPVQHGGMNFTISILVNSDLMELMHLNFGKVSYAFAPFGDSRPETGFSDS